MRQALQGGGGRDIKEYKWMPYERAAKFIRAAADCGVSEVARSRRGFMGQYKIAGSKEKMRNRPVAGSKTQTWGTRRHNFISRHMKQYVKHSTYRRWLAFVMWAYKPPGPVPENTQCRGRR